MISGKVATVYFGNQWSLDEVVIPALTISSVALVLISLIIMASNNESGAAQMDQPAE